MKSALRLAATLVACALTSAPASAQTFSDGGTHDITTPTGFVQVKNGSTVNVKPGGVVTGGDSQTGMLGFDAGTRINVLGGIVRGGNSSSNSAGDGIDVDNGVFVTVGPGSQIIGGNSLTSGSFRGGDGMTLYGGATFTGGTVRGGDSASRSAGSGAYFSAPLTGESATYQIDGASFTGGNGGISGGQGARAGSGDVTIFSGTFKGGSASTVFGSPSGTGYEQTGGTLNLYNGTYTGGAVTGGLGSAGIAIRGDTTARIAGGTFTGGGTGANQGYAADFSSFTGQTLTADISGGTFNGSLHIGTLLGRSTVSFFGLPDLDVRGAGTSTMSLVGTLFAGSSINSTLLFDPTKVNYTREVVKVQGYDQTRIMFFGAPVPEPAAVVSSGLGLLLLGSAYGYRSRRAA